MAMWLCGYVATWLHGYENRKSDIFNALIDELIGQLMNEPGATPIRYFFFLNALCEIVLECISKALWERRETVSHVAVSGIYFLAF